MGPGERPQPPASPTPTPPRAALDASATHQRGGPVTPLGLRVYVRGSGELESLLPRAVEMKRESAALAVPRSPGPGVRRWPGRRGTRALAVAGARESGGVCHRPGPRHSAVNCAVPDLGRHPLLVSLRDQDGGSHTCLMTSSPGRAPSSGQETPPPENVLGLDSRGNARRERHLQLEGGGPALGTQRSLRERFPKLGRRTASARLGVSFCKNFSYNVIFSAIKKSLKSVTFQTTLFF